MPETLPLPVACFAPPLTDSLLSSYSSLISSYAASPDADPETKDALSSCLSCVSKWWSLPASQRKDGKRFEIHVPVKGTDGKVVVKNGRVVRKPVEFAVTPLEEGHVKELWDVTPWMRELNTLSNVEGTGPFDKLTGKLRDCAFHLLWHCKEITLDREPLTQDIQSLS